MSIIDIMPHEIAIAYLQAADKYFLPDTQAGYDLALYRIAHEIWQRGSEYCARNIDAVTFLVVNDGASRVCMDGVWSDLHPGNMVVYGNQTVTRIEVDADMDVYVICLAAGCTQMLRLYGLEQGILLDLRHSFAEVRHICGQMLQIALSEIPLRQKLCNHYLRLLMGVFESENTTDASTDNGECIVESVCQYIESNLDMLHDMQPIIKYSGYSQEHLGRLFKKHRGVTTLRYLRQRQMMLARELIRNSGFTLSQAAEYFGFSDAYAFSKTFRKLMGHSPGKERR